MSERETRYIVNYLDGDHVPVDGDGELHIDRTPMLCETLSEWDMAARWIDELFRAGCTLPVITLYTQMMTDSGKWQTVQVRDFTGPTTDLSQPESSQEFEFPESN